ncbi:MAG TPA: DUF3352 domain-containing protein [Solirubrobacteraceae bacterium]|nr:DUF3352 domain-containing protein [Solirubrobacteraceae bacterium]
MFRSRRLFRTLTLPLAAASALAVSACGGSGGDPSADPAAIVPAGSAVYVEANLKPGDEVKELATKLSGEEDPGAAFRRWFEKEVADESPDFSFSEDIDPWLGERVGVFVPRVAAGGDNAVGAVFATEDADKAEESLEELLRQDEGGQKPRVESRTHRDTEYFVDTSDNDAAGVVDGYAVAGSEAAVRAVIDQASGDSDSLADTSEYEKARDAIEADGVGFVYVRLSQVLSALGPQGVAVRQVLGGIGETIAVGLDGDESKIEAESASLGVSGDAVAGPGEVLAQLPASAWLAAGVADVGTRIDQALDQLSQLGGLAGQDPEQLLDQIEAQLGIDPRRDLAAWMGDIGIFAFGDSLSEAGGGLIAATKDPAATRRSIPRLARFLGATAELRSRPLDRSGIDTGVTMESPQLPVPIHMALTDDERFIVAVTDAALAQALRDTEPLGETQPFKDAASALGEGIEPQLFVNFAPLAGFVEGLGAGGRPEGRQVVEALRKLTTLAAGSKREDDVLRGRLVVGVK